jgi:hypothetical protein
VMYRSLEGDEAAEWPFASPETHKGT